MRGQLLEPNLVVVMQTAFVIVDKYGSGDVHRVYQAKSFLDSALPQQVFDRAGDIDEAPASGNLKPKVFG